MAEHEGRSTGFQVLRTTPSLRLRGLVLGGALVAFGWAYWSLPGFQAPVHRITSMMVRGDFSALKAFMLSFGAWAAVLSFLLMILQTLIAPLPAFTLAIANAMTFGMVYGFVLTCFSALVAGFTAFYLSRWFGGGPSWSGP